MHGDALRGQPTLDQTGGVGIEHPWQHVVFPFDDCQVPAPLVHRVEHDETDEPGPDHGHPGRLVPFGSSQQAGGVFEGPQRLNTGQVRARHRQPGGSSTGGNQQVVVFDRAAVVQCHGAGGRVDSADPLADLRIDTQPAEVIVIGGVSVFAGNLAREPVGQGHPRMGRLVADQRDRRFAVPVLPDRLDRVGGHRATADDDMLRHGQSFPCSRRPSRPPVSVGPAGLTSTPGRVRPASPRSAHPLRPSPVRCSRPATSRPGPRSRPLKVRRCEVH